MELKWDWEKIIVTDVWNNDFSIMLQANNF